MGDRGLRARVYADQYSAVLVIGLALLVVVGGFVTYSAYGQTRTTTETTTETVSTWSSTGQFTHQATVVNGTAVFRENSTLTNRTVYYRRIAPVLNGSFVYEYTASENGSLSMVASLDLLIQSVGETGENQTEYWRVEEPLDRTNASLAPDESLRVTFSRNVSAIAQRVERIEQQLGAAPGTTETAVVATVTLDGTRNGRPVDRRRTYSLPITVQDALYRVNDTGPVTDGGELTEQVRTTVVVPAGPLWRLGGPVLVVAGLAGLAVFGAGRYTGQLEVTDREREYLAYRSERAEFDEWITEARLPSDWVAQADTRVETTTLSGLVDLAIDTDRRVLETVENGTYLVLDGETVYSYDPPTLPGDDSGEPLRIGDAGGDVGTTSVADADSVEAFEDPFRSVVSSSGDDDTTPEEEQDGDTEESSNSS